MACHYTRKIVPLSTNMGIRTDFHVDEVRGDRVSGRIATHRRIGTRYEYESAHVSPSSAVMTRSQRGTSENASANDCEESDVLI